MAAEERRLALVSSFGLPTEESRRAMLALGEEIVKKTDKEGNSVMTHGYIAVPLHSNNSLCALLVLNRKQKTKCFTLTELREATNLAHRLLQASESLKLTKATFHPLK